MGNLSARCFSDEAEPKNEKRQFDAPLFRNEENIADISIQQQQLNLNNSQPIQQYELDDCDFCSSHFKKLIQSERLPLLTYPREEKKKKSHSLEINILNESLQFSEPLAILNNDKIQQYTSSWYQLMIALPKFVKPIILIDEEIKTDKQFQDFINEPVPEVDYCCLICIKWCVVDFFQIPQNPLAPKNNKLLDKCYKIFNNIVHICLSYKELFLKNFQQNKHVENINLYVKLYQRFVKQMNAFQNKYEKDFEAVQLNYEKIFPFKNEDQNYPFFKLVGYMMRFWCQIVLTYDVEDKLIDSYRNLDIKLHQQLLFSYFICALDVNLNEYNIHWIGHRKYFTFDRRLIDKNFNFIDRVKTNFDEVDVKQFFFQIDEVLRGIEILYPSWFFEFEFQCLAIKYKILQLVKLIKKQNEQEISKLKKLDGKNNILSFIQQETTIEDISKLSQFEIIISTAESMDKDTQEDQLMALYLQEPIFDNLRPISKFRSSEKLSINSQQSSKLTTNPSSFLSQKEKSSNNFDDLRTNTSIATNLKASDEALQISKAKVEPEHKQLLSQFNEELKIVQQKLQIREFILEQRAQKFNISVNRNVNVQWLNYFQKTEFQKIPGEINKKYFIEILKVLTQVYPIYQTELMQFRS